MIANYHTHTWRCRHAAGTEQEYVEAAITRGMKTLGFADHTPYCFPEGYYSGFRMKPEETAEYAATVLDLRDRYRDAIDIRLGVEMEYYPGHFADTLSLLRDNQVEYLILGQHFPGNEYHQPYCGSPTVDEERLRQYCRQVMDAMNTGFFTYLAHPDLLNFHGDEQVYRQLMTEMCREARACDIPLEINLLGLGENRHYPRNAFWECAAEEGCKAILGCDAHTPEGLLAVKTEQRALALAKQWGITVWEDVPLRQI